MTIEESFCLERRVEDVCDEAIDVLRRGRLFSLTSRPSTPLAQATDDGLWRMAQDLKALDVVHASLQQSPHAVRLRDVYYRDVRLWQTQRASDRAVQRVAARLHVPRHFLNIQPSSKDLVAGDLTVIVDQHWWHTWLLASSGVQLLPTGRDVRLQIMANTAVVIVEKDAVFGQLVPVLKQRVRQADFAASKWMICTGKGFPSSTLQRALQTMSAVDVAGQRAMLLVDWDVYGLEIAWCYARSLPTGVKAHLVALSHRQLHTTAMDHQERPSPSAAMLASRLIPLTDKDRRRIQLFLQRLPQAVAFDDDSPTKHGDNLLLFAQTLRAEALEMLKQGIKAELDVLDVDILIDLILQN